MPILLCHDRSLSAKHAGSVAHATLGHKPLMLLHIHHSERPTLVVPAPAR